MMTGMGADEYFVDMLELNYFKVINIKISSTPLHLIKSTKSINIKLRVMLVFIFFLTKNKQTRIILCFLLLRSRYYRRNLTKKIFQAKSLLNRLNLNLKNLENIEDLGKMLILFERYYVMPEYMCLPLDTVAQRFKIEMRSPFLTPEFDYVFRTKTEKIYTPGKEILRNYLMRTLDYRSNKK